MTNIFFSKVSNTISDEEEEYDTPGFQHSFPFMCAVYYKNPKTGNKEIVCSATIIKHNWMLTAAHCIPDHDNPESIQVLCGKWDVSVREQGQQWRNIKQIFTPNQFSLNQMPDSLSYDISLVS